MDQLLKEIRKLPPLPEAVARVCQLADDPECDIREIADVISLDETLTARLLRISNSAFYGLTHKVSSVRQAVMVLGLRGVRNLALGVAVVGLKGRGDHEPALDRNTFWRHSLSVAIGTRMLGQELRLKCDDESFVAGLLHDIGKVVFGEFLAEPYAKILRRAQAGEAPLYALERQELGIDHASLGREICRHWKIPVTLTRVVYEHHGSVSGPDGDGEDDNLLAVVRIANSLAKMSDAGADPDVLVAPDFLNEMDRLEMEWETAERVMRILPGEVARAASCFGFAPDQSRVKVGTGRASPVVGVEAGSPLVDRAVRAGLISRGYHVCGIGEAREALRWMEAKYSSSAGEELEPPEGFPDHPILVGVVTERALDGAFAEMLERREIPVLDLKDWREQGGGTLADDHPTAPGALPVKTLESWLGQGLAAAARRMAA
jgi:putative nucleotidyltransferase with HDIG domain